MPAEQFPAELWPRLLARESVTFTAALDDDVVTSVSLVSSVDHESAAPGPIDRPAVFATESEVTVVLAPITRLVVAGQGPIADALAAQGNLLGWKVSLETRPGMVAGLAAGLSQIDGIVVMGHDIEMSSTCLMHALESDAGYIGALGSESMQVSRADWLAMRDVVDLSRVQGPAGLRIGSQGPAEIAVSIVAEMIATLVKTAMQPGMPQGCGSVTVDSRTVPIITLPGNPVSSYVSFENYVRPVIRTMLGADIIQRPDRMATITEGMQSPDSKRQFARGHLDRAAGAVTPVGGQGSHVVGGLAQANCLIVIKEGVSAVTAGDSVRVIECGE